MGMITDDKKYADAFRISSYHVDAKQLLRPASFMDLAQEMAYQTSELMHFGFADLQKSHFVWVLTRMQIRFHRRPRWGEEVRFATWCKKAMSVFFLRDFRMTGTDGQPLVEATTSWTVIDAGSRKMVRGEEINSLVSTEWICDDAVFDTPADKVVVPKGVELQPAALHTAAYSDIDVVGHTNNTRYLAWAMDCIPYDYLMAHELREVCINFNQECRPGQTVEIGCATLADDTFCIAGQADGKQSFAVRLQF